ncbi:DUF3570 domain-containing protein [Ferruginibacter albus]|uniref:DUF3570 domain-containing protein n=1 Tax=Ferruginibacter albus TaxID=2875540 RepID=UPI001CC43BCE|nr:DUF3570 domain-containing protein [Ferruginibacter albus]UAY51478.1 DUF3570 domain-containing protein [Ferruginibacter albus]
MKKICLVVVGLYLHLLHAFSQTAALDSSQYKNRKLTLSEINFVHSYYNQDGDHSAVTGGIGTQELKDYANSIELTLIKYDKYNRKNNLDIDLGVDYYTSASSDKIDPYTISSASGHDLHVYPSAVYTIDDEAKRKKIKYELSLSAESDYLSIGFGGGFAKTSKDKSREFEAKAKIYLDHVKMILPIELRDSTTGGLPNYNFHDYRWSRRNTFSTSFTLSQIINQRLQVLFLLDPTYQHGFLSLPFHRIYFKDGAEAIEKLPNERYKLPIGVRANYFLGDKFIIRSYYRFYIDDWGLKAHTADIETVIQFSPFFSISPFYRYYTQTAINWFAPYAQHFENEQYYSSTYDLSAFHSHFFGSGVRIAPPNGLFKNRHLNMLEVRYGHYLRSDDFHSDVISLNLKWER